MRSLFDSFTCALVLLSMCLLSFFALFVIIHDVLGVMIEKECIELGYVQSAITFDLDGYCFDGNKEYIKLKWVRLKNEFNRTN